MTSTQTIHYQPGPYDHALACSHAEGGPTLGISSPCDTSIWIHFAPRHLPALRKYVAALEAYEANEQGKRDAAKTEVAA